MLMNLWDLFVENVAGGFWLSVVILTIIILIILALGGLSGFTILTYLTLFFVAMAYGYGYPLINVLVFAIALYYAVSQFNGWLERSGGN